MRGFNLHHTTILAFPTTVYERYFLLHTSKTGSPTPLYESIIFPDTVKTVSYALLEKWFSLDGYFFALLRTVYEGLTQFSRLTVYLLFYGVDFFSSLAADSIWENFFRAMVIFWPLPRLYMRGLFYRPLTNSLSADSIWRNFLSNTWQMPSRTPLYERFFVGYRNNALSADSIWKEVFHAALLPTIPA